jgi:hypothetical protein
MTSITTTNKQAFLKVDILGRVTTPAQQREDLLDLFERSGMSGAAFAKLHGIRYPTFATWRQKRRRLRISSGEESPPAQVACLPLPDLDAESCAALFHEVVLDQASSDLSIELASGMTMKISRPDQVSIAAHLIAQLKELQGC